MNNTTCPLAFLAFTCIPETSLDFSLGHVNSGCTDHCTTKTTQTLMAAHRQKDTRSCMQGDL